MFIGLSFGDEKKYFKYKDSLNKDEDLLVYNA